MNTQERASKLMESAIVQFECGDYTGAFLSTRQQPEPCVTDNYA